MEGYCVKDNPSYDGREISLNTEYKIKDVVVALIINNNDGLIVNNTRKGPYRIIFDFFTTNFEFSAVEITGFNIESSLGTNYKDELRVSLPISSDFKTDTRFEHNNRYAFIDIEHKYNFNFKLNEIITVELQARLKKQNGEYTKPYTLKYKCYPKIQKIGSLS